HHAYLFWAAGRRVYEISDAVLRRAIAATPITAARPAAAQDLQLPELRVWGSPNGADPPEPLDGVFVHRTEAALSLAVLAIFGMRPDRPGFSAVGLEGRADPDDPSAGEIEIAATREDGSPPFGPKLAGGTAAGLYSVANAGELLLLTGRLLGCSEKRRKRDTGIGTRVRFPFLVSRITIRQHAQASHRNNPRRAAQSAGAKNHRAAEAGIPGRNLRAAPFQRAGARRRHNPLGAVHRRPRPPGP